jgi:radical SAM superfamily enzyme YgiQ (UPF0313 family)
LVRSNLFHYIVRGEGELAIAPILAEIESGSRPPVRVVDGPVVTDLDSNPFPFIFPLYREEILSKKHIFPTMVSRRCPGTCKFCYPIERLVFGPKTKWRSVENVFAEIGLYYDQCAITEVLIYDNMFTTWSKYVVDFARQKVDRGYDFVYGVNARADKLDEETIRALAESRCTMVFLGVESGSQRLLDFLGKRMKAEENLRAARLCKQYGIAVLANLLVGVPGEEEEDYRLTYDLLERMEPDIIAYNCFTPFPGSEMYEYCLKQNLIDANMPYSSYEMHLTKNGRPVRGVDYERMKRWEPRILGLARNQPQIMTSASLERLEHAIGLQVAGKAGDAQQILESLSSRTD